MLNTKLNKIIMITKSEIYRNLYDIFFIKPCYFIKKLSANSIVVDVGTGPDADFSQALIDLYGLKSFGFDPTIKHHKSLDILEKKNNGRFKYYKYALASKKEIKLFFESEQNISGSFLSDHTNVKNDIIKQYRVECITVNDIFDIIGVKNIDLLKIDLEGEEYSVLNSINKTTLDRIGQLIVEFHHNSVEHSNFNDTIMIVKKLENYGYKYFTRDCTNFLFFRKMKSCKV